MNELEVLKKAIYKQSQRIAELTLDLDLAYAQIDLLTEQKKEEKTEVPK